MSKTAPKVVINLHLPVGFYEQLMLEKPGEASRNSYLLALLTKGFFAMGEERTNECESERARLGNASPTPGITHFARHG